MRAWAAKNALWILSVIALLVVGGWLFGAPILRWAQNRVDRAEARTERQTDETQASQLETKGAQKAEVLVEHHYETVTEWRDRVIEKNREIYRAPDAQAPLPADVAAGLHAFDQQLCSSRLGPRCRTDDGRLAPGGDAGGGAGGLPDDGGGAEPVSR